MTVRILRADVVVPGPAAPIGDGAVAVAGGRILGVGPAAEVRAAHPAAAEVRFDGVMTPGLVNAHTHLQYTGFAHLGRASHAGFEEWSVAFDGEYGARVRAEDWYGAVVEGARQALSTGTTTVADISTNFEALPAVKETGLRGVVYLETLGHTEKVWKAGERHRYLAALEQAQALQDDRVRIGVSPHAPYSLDTPVLTDMATVARERGMRLHTHLAESAYEDEYCRHATGALAEFVEGFGRNFQIILTRGTGMGTAEFSHRVGLLGADTHVAHGIYLDGDGRALLRDLDVPVALCPRSNRVIGLQSPPVAAYLTEANPVAVGTDSLASSPSLDLLAEVRALYDLARDQGYERDDLAPRLFDAATRGGARALGLDSPTDGVGVIAPGRRADLAVFDLDATPDEAVEHLVRDGAGRCTTTVIDGEPSFSRTDCTP